MDKQEFLINKKVLADGINHLPYLTITNNHSAGDYSFPASRQHLIITTSADKKKSYTPAKWGAALITSIQLRLLAS